MTVDIILNLKGGVAKTATAVNMAAILAHDYGQRVLLIDADSQCNATEFYGADAKQGNLAEILRYTGDDAATFAATQVQPTDYPGVWIIAGDDSLMDLDLTKVELETARVTALRDFLALAATRSLYDRVIIDCPPAFNAASAAALLAGDEVIIPIKLDAFSLRGMTNLMRQIDNMRKINPSLKLGGLLPTMWYGSDSIKGAERLLRESAYHVYPHIRRTNKVDDMTFKQRPIIASSPNSAAALDYRRFVGELIGGGVSSGRL